MSDQPDKDNRLASAQLHGRRLLVSGAASGIGAATARQFANEGASVVLLDRDAEAAGQLASEIGASAVVADVSSEAEVSAAVAAAAKAMGGIDGLVNAAGLNSKTALEDLDLAEWRRVLDVNLTGPYLLCRAALAHLRESGRGTIVNIASGAALLPASPRAGAYNASKGGLVAFTKGLALELAPLVRVNAVCPGATDTLMFRAAAAATSENIASRYALRRIGRAEEIAEAVTYLTSERSSFVTGVALAVDGGRSFH